MAFDLRPRKEEAVADWAISPKYTSSQLAAGEVTPAEVLEDQVKGWVLDFAQELSQKEHSGIAVMMLCTSYFEWIESLRRGEDGKGKSKEFFENTFDRLFPDLGPSACGPEVSDMLYFDLRCGLYHDGLMRGNIVFRRGGPPIDIRRNPLQVVINANAFLQTVFSDFEQYLDNLRRDGIQNELKRNFEESWLRRTHGAPEQPTAAPPQDRIALETRAPPRPVVRKM